MTKTIFEFEYGKGKYALMTGLKIEPLNAAAKITLFVHKVRNCFLNLEYNFVDHVDSYSCMDRYQGFQILETTEGFEVNVENYAEDYI